MSARLLAIVATAGLTVLAMMPGGCVRVGGSRPLVDVRVEEQPRPAEPVQPFVEPYDQRYKEPYRP